MTAVGLAIDAAAWSSRWRRRAVGDKMLLSLGLAGCALALPAVPACPVVLVVAGVLAVGPAGVDPRALLRAVRLPAMFVVLAAAPVAVELRLWPGLLIEITAAGAGRAADLALHGLAGSAAILLLAVTTPLSDLIERLRSLRVPAPLIEISLIMYRMLFSLVDSVRAIRAAQLARLGYAGRRAALRSAAGLTAAVLTRSWDRARRLEEGLAGRGAEGRLRVLTEAEPSAPRFVAGTVAGLGLLVVSSLLWRYGWPAVTGGHPAAGGQPATVPGWPR